VGSGVAAFDADVDVAGVALACDPPGHLAGVFDGVGEEGESACLAAGDQVDDGGVVDLAVFAVASWCWQWVGWVVIAVLLGYAW